MKAHWPIQGCAIFPTNPNFEEQIVFVEPTNYSDNIDEVCFFSEDDPKDATYVCTLSSSSPDIHVIVTSHILAQVLTVSARTESH